MVKEKEPYSYLSIEKVKTDVTFHPVPQFSFNIAVSDTKHSSERQVYTVFALVSDIGGFNGAITILPAFFLAKYNSMMYSASVFHDVKIRGNRR